MAIMQPLMWNKQKNGPVLIVVVVWTHFLLVTLSENMSEIKISPMSDDLPQEKCGIAQFLALKLVQSPFKTRIVKLEMHCWQ